MVTWKAAEHLWKCVCRELIHGHTSVVHLCKIWKMLFLRCNKMWVFVGDRLNLNIQNQGSKRNISRSSLPGWMCSCGGTKHVNYILCSNCTVWRILQQRIVFSKCYNNSTQGGWWTVKDKVKLVKETHWVTLPLHKKVQNQHGGWLWTLPHASTTSGDLSASVPPHFLW